jgi:uncharacterized protein
MTERQALLDRLEDVHSFPGTYMFKVIGANSESFVESVKEAAVGVIGAEVELEVSTRESSGGKHLSVTMSLRVEAADEVLEIYAALQELEQARFIL